MEEVIEEVEADEGTEYMTVTVLEPWPWHTEIDESEPTEW